jgi:rod shape determining protein RodA
MTNSVTGLFSPRRLFSARHVRWFAVDWHILLIAIVLLCFGMTFVHAMSYADASAMRDGVDFETHAKKVFVTLPLIVAGMLLRPGWLARHSRWIYGATLALLCLLFLVGEERNGAKRWIELPMFDLQPSEIAKLGVILMLARLLERNRLERARDWRAPVLAVLVPMGLVALQPDLGTALTLVPLSLGMLYLAGARGSILLAILLACGTAGFVAVESHLFHAYQVQRVETWLDSFEAEDLLEQKNRAGFHIYHARTAIGNGNWLGRGLGRGVANSTGHLPERDSDSIFAVVAEETGFVGVAGILGLYTLLVILLLASAAGLRDRFARLVVGGVALYFGSHVFIHAGVNLGLLPMTGLTLPLFSTGGSSLLVTFLALGIALGLSSQHEMQLDQDAFRTY